MRLQDHPDGLLRLERVIHHEHPDAFEQVRQASVPGADHFFPG
jgi:hypothetical protein